MKTSETIQELSKALVKASGELKNPVKNAVNPHFKNRYADLTSIIEVSRKTLAENGLAVIQGVECEGALVRVQTRILHLTGEWIESEITMQSESANPQKIGSAITYGRRYGLSAILGISADDDDDGAIASEKGQKKQTPKPAQKQLIKKQPEPDMVVVELKKYFDGLFFEPQERGKIVMHYTEKLGLPDWKNLNDDGKKTILRAIQGAEEKELLDIIGK